MKSGRINDEFGDCLKFLKSNQDENKNFSQKLKICNESFISNASKINNKENQSSSNIFKYNIPLTKNHYLKPNSLQLDTKYEERLLEKDALIKKFPSELLSPSCSNAAIQFSPSNGSMITSFTTMFPRNNDDFLRYKNSGLTKITPSCTESNDEVEKLERELNRVISLNKINEKSSLVKSPEAKSTKPKLSQKIIRENKKSEASNIMKEVKEQNIAAAPIDNHSSQKLLKKTDSFPVRTLDIDDFVNDYDYDMGNFRVPDEEPLDDFILVESKKDRKKRNKSTSENISSTNVAKKFNYHLTGSKSFNSSTPSYSHQNSTNSSTSDNKKIPHKTKTSLAVTNRISSVQTSSSTSSSIPHRVMNDFLLRTWKDFIGSY